MERLPKNVTIIYLANPSLSRDDILYAIADELRLNVQESARSSVVLRALHDNLIKSFSEGRQVVVLIDEAHAMPAETLEEIRLLSNLETNRNKLLQLVLFGQPELNDILARPEMRQLKERITHNFRLEPLVREDISHYLDFRMRAAGYRGPSVFSPTALKVIAQNSLGLTRRINILADKALLAAFSSGSHQIGPKEIQAAVRDCEFSEATYGSHKTGKTRTPWIVAALLAVAFLAGIAWLVVVSRSDSGAPSAVVVPPAPAPGAGGTTPAAPPESSAPVVPAAPAAPASPAAPGPPAATVGAQPASPTTSATAPSPPDTPPAARLEPTVATAPPEPAEPAVGRLTLERLEAGRAWLEQLPDDQWFIQVFATDASRHGDVETLLRKLSSSGIEMSNIHVYYSGLSGKPRYGITYGNYPSRSAASAAMRGLPQVCLLYTSDAADE